ncbi:MAG TPA: hypothetical protein VF081_06940 [Solirubrobacterales bacterium]
MVLSIIAVIGISFGFQLIVNGLNGDDPDDSARIEEILTGFYEEPALGQCGSLTTDRFRSAVYGGSGDGALEACREHQEARAKLAKLDRSVFIDHIEVDGEKAVAEVRAGGISLTESLVKENDEWLLDDEASPFHDSDGSKELVGAEAEQDAAPKSFGDSSRFTNIPGFGPDVAISLVPRPPLDPGQDRSGREQASIIYGNAFGQPGKPTRSRYVNLPITLVNTGEKPFRGDIGGFATTANGRQLTPLDARELTQQGPLFGRMPDWAVGEPKGIAPGASSTRYLTFVLPLDQEIVEWQLEPRILSGPGSLAAMESLDGNTYR